MLSGAELDEALDESLLFAHALKAMTIASAAKPALTDDPILSSTR
jgi:hypothetical protein